MKHLTFNQLDRKIPVENAIYNIWAECVFNEAPESEKVDVHIKETSQEIYIHYEYNGEEILHEKGHYYFTEDAHVVIFLDNPRYCQKFIAFERTENYMEIAYI